MPTPPWISSGPPQPNRPRRRTATDWTEAAVLIVLGGATILGTLLVVAIILLDALFGVRVGPIL